MNLLDFCFQNEKKISETVTPDLALSTLPQSLKSSIALVTTAQPTSPTSPGGRRANRLVVNEAEVVHLQADKSDNEDEDIDIEDSGDEIVSETDDKDVYRSLIEAAGIASSASRASESRDSIDEMSPASGDSTDLSPESVILDGAPGEKPVVLSTSEIPKKPFLKNQECSDNPSTLYQNIGEDGIDSADEFPELENGEKTSFFYCAF